MGAERFDVRDEVPGGVVNETPKWSASTTTTLVEKHYAVLSWVKEPTHLGFGTGARATVQKYRRFAGPVASLLEIDPMSPADEKESATIRLDRRVQRTWMLDSRRHVRAPTITGTKTTSPARVSTNGIVSERKTRPTARSKLRNESRECKHQR